MHGIFVYFSPLTEICNILRFSAMKTILVINNSLPFTASFQFLTTILPNITWQSHHLLKQVSFRCQAAATTSQLRLRHRGHDVTVMMTSHYCTIIQAWILLCHMTVTWQSHDGVVDGDACWHPVRCPWPLTLDMEPSPPPPLPHHHPSSYPLTPRLHVPYLYCCMGFVLAISATIYCLGHVSLSCLQILMLIADR